MSLKDFQDHPNRLSPREIRLLLLLAVGLSLILGLLVLGNYYLADLLPTGGEFSLLRTAAQSFLFDRIEPYSANVPSAVQQEVYGRLAQPGEKPYILDIPFHLLPIFFPLGLIRNELFAKVFWLVVLEIGLLAFLIMSLRLASERVPLLPGGVIVLLCYGSFYAVQSLRIGSVVILLGVLYTGILLALRVQMDELAGALIVLSAFNWQIGAPFLIFIVVSVYWAQRWRVFLGAVMLVFILMTISFLLYPGWILPFLRATWNNLQTGFGYSTRLIFSSLWPKYGETFSWILTSVLVIVLGYEWSESRGANFQRVVWVACLTIAMTPLLGFPSEVGNLVVLLVPLVTILLAVRERWKSAGRILVAFLFVTILGLPWLVFLGMTPLPLEMNQYFLFLFLPTAAVLGLYWIRWWMIRLPRTWMDQVSSMRG
jgi:hypothetical protein